MSIESELYGRQAVLLGLEREEAENHLADLAIHLALVYGATPHERLAGIIAGMPWTADRWEEWAEEAREALGLANP